MLEGTLRFTGKTLDDVELAIGEALRRIGAGNTSGFDSNADGLFTFEVTGYDESLNDC